MTRAVGAVPTSAGGRAARRQGTGECDSASSTTDFTGQRRIGSAPAASGRKLMSVDPERIKFRHSQTGDRDSNKPTRVPVVGADAKRYDCC